MDQHSFSPASFGAQGSFQNFPSNSASHSPSQQQFNAFANQQQQHMAQGIPGQTSTNQTPQQQHSSLSNSNTTANTPASISSPSVLNGATSPLLQQSPYLQNQNIQGQHNLPFNINSREDIQKCILVSQ